MLRVLGRGTVIATCLASVVAPPHAYAQAPDCTAISDDVERLACYDATAKRPAAPPAAAKAPADPIIGKARAAVAKTLRDPPSARFEGIVRKSEAVCGLLNAKNAYGGYTGNTRFGYVISNGEIFIEVPITLLSTHNLAEYERNDAGLKRYCPGVKSPFVRDDPPTKKKK